MEKYFRGRQATVYHMAHAHCLLDTQGYKHTLRISNNLCFSTATKFARRQINVTFKRILFVFLFKSNNIWTTNVYCFLIFVSRQWHKTSPPHLITSSPHYLITSSPHHLLTSSPPHLLTSSPHHLPDPPFKAH